MVPKLEDEDGGTVQIHARKANRSNAGSKHHASTVSAKATTKQQHHNNPTSNTNYALAISHIVQTLISSYDSNESLNFTALKAKAARKYKLPGVPRITDILASIPVDYKPKLLPFLRQKPVRTASGVAVVAVMSKPHRCPHIAMTGGLTCWKFALSRKVCVCTVQAGLIRTLNTRRKPTLATNQQVCEPSELGTILTLRLEDGSLNFADWDTASTKLSSSSWGGHSCRLTNFMYKDYFIRNLHDALSGHKSSSVEEAVRYSEQSTTKCIGITIETRPDYCLKPHLSEMLGYGCTRIEIGVQSIYESVARETNRGHTVSAVANSFHLAKDCGFKVVTHMMPDLPNTGIERDLTGFLEFFENPAFRPDGLKLYPTLVIRGTGLYELWKTGRYQNYTPDELVELTSQVMAIVPPWTRVYRIQRDIPMPLVSSGVEHGNLRELALARMRDLDLQCKDIRTREVGMKQIQEAVSPDDVELIRRDYVANGGWETFLAYEDPQKDILIGLLRLRKASSVAFRPEISGASSSIVRELHVYGTAVAVSGRDASRFQHQGFGMLLMEEAERIAREEHGSEKILVISGVGTRHYYRKMGYQLDGPYMSKKLERYE
ncbi:hypothetical protein THAOC_26764 [Thalassiosira oceanica]|uniref:Elongator complex protein 3 n=1 Tax=Thalassiosira oceanica TaxID=159749 RepID=K0RJ87_THAOC|nr:hypothetical protein THAOC_26764 [Thalassiosira oceanica]|eukprot:EJK53738.1 hypothetical protein THAOC_26764 [Thalassiosira oceanica]